MDKPNQNQPGNQGGQQGSGPRQNQPSGSSVPQQAPMNMLPPTQQMSSQDKNKMQQSSPAALRAGAQSMNWNYTLIWIILILVVIGAGWWIGGANFASNSSSGTATTTDDVLGEDTDDSDIGVVPELNDSAAPEVMVPISGVGNSVSLVNQPAGDSVLVQSATLSRLGWIAVLDSR